MHSMISRCLHRRLSALGPILTLWRNPFLKNIQLAACKANLMIEGLLSQGKEREANRAANQAALLKGGALDSLLALALGSGGVPSPAVRSQVRRVAACWP